MFGLIAFKIIPTAYVSLSYLEFSDNILLYSQGIEINSQDSIPSSCVSIDATKSKVFIYLSSFLETAS